MIDNQMYPLLFALLPGKSQTIYTRFLEKLKSTMEDLHLQLNPTVLFMDFESAAQNAAKAAFPGITLKGCFFHYTQCIWRKTQQLGLQTHYRDNEDIHRLIRRAAVLPLIRIEDYWFNAWNDLKDVNLPVETTTFTDYVTTQWVEGDRNIWNQFDNDGPRTTNTLEGWHSKLKKRIPSSHPNIYLFIRVLKEVQAANDVSLIQHAAGGLPAQKRRCYRVLNERLVHLKTLPDDGQIDYINYGDRATYLLHME
ncbi:uncharacterized protein LOC132559482 [Ylistrum balloti]|uniref:uncharacterized protein LOC132559482 n=1 Tax=Ylistrum balloti TaxID=509963 RepID=UPI0029059533|nr:uncharacterized protein LOC132559482 [Ylistrum balloti]